jgi:hypothetical protein
MREFTSSKTLLGDDLESASAAVLVKSYPIRLDDDPAKRDVEDKANRGSFNQVYLILLAWHLPRIPLVNKGPSPGLIRGS